MRLDRGFLRVEKARGVTKIVTGEGRCSRCRDDDLDRERDRRRDDRRIGTARGADVTGGDVTIADRLSHEDCGRKACVHSPMVGVVRR